MSASSQQALNTPRQLHERDIAPRYGLGIQRSGRTPTPTSEPAHHWLLDLGALARCRSLMSGHEVAQTSPGDALTAIHQSSMDVPVAYDQFCRSHFASVKRLHPELSWDDACPAYAIALSAHAVLCVALDEGREAQLELNWPLIRGQSNLAWSQARPLIADGCSALARLDPLAMHR